MTNKKKPHLRPINRRPATTDGRLPVKTPQGCGEGPLKGVVPESEPKEGKEE